MNTRIVYSLMMAAALMPATLCAQTAEATSNAQAQSVVQSRTPNARIDAAMQAAARANIPASMLQNKVAEGEAKQVPQERIAAAVEARLQTLIRASETMKRADVEGTSELAVTADAIEVGVSQNALIKVARSAPSERRAVAIATLSGLVQLGHASEHALTRVTAVVGSNAALANLQAEVATQLQVGGINSNAAGVVRIR